jgi:nitrate reductase assembly molybdenum cofactor insertion protein NarJ
VWQEELVVVMNDEKRYLRKLLSILLQYPDDEFILSLEELKEAVAQIPQVEQRERCVNFLDYLGNNSNTPQLLT